MSRRLGSKKLETYDEPWDGRLHDILQRIYQDGEPAAVSLDIEILQDRCSHIWIQDGPKTS